MKADIMIIDDSTLNMSPSQRATDLIKRMDVQEKLAQLTCVFLRKPTLTLDDGSNHLDEILEDRPYGVGHVSCLEMRMGRDLGELAEFQKEVQKRIMALSRHAIPAAFHMEAISGAYLPGATSFPSGISRGASFDPELEERIGSFIGAQERAMGITYSLAPVLDLARDTRMGRANEPYGEDPTLAARMGSAFTRGLQGLSRRGEDAPLRRTESIAKHFMGFHAGEGGIHGAHANIPERLMREVYGKPFQAAITEAGLRGIMPCYNSIGGEIASSSHHLLTEVLREAMGFDGVVASDYGAIGNMHMFQRTAASFPEAGLEAMTAGMDIEWHVVQGFCEELGRWFESGRADIAILDRAVTRVLESKFRMGLFDDPFAFSGADLYAPFEDPRGRELALQSARESLVLLRNDGTLPLFPEAAQSGLSNSSISRIAVIGPHAANARYFFGGYTHLSMVEATLAASASMAGMVNLDNGEYTYVPVPGTKVQSDEEQRFDDVLDALHPRCRSLIEELRERLPGVNITWSKGYQIAGADDSAAAEALEAAKGADLVICTLGGKNGSGSIATMGEGVDAVDIGLPAGQENFLERLAKLGIPVIGVHIDGRPISSDAADRCLNALIEAWNPAECGAEALVDLILGAIEPSGRLPLCVAHSVGQLPVYHNHPNGSQWHQGSSIGFPDYVDSPHTPRFHYGYGLSYTSFAYSDMNASCEQVEATGSVAVSMTVTNTGERRGTEVVQLYGRDLYATMVRPVLECMGFQRVDLDPGETATVAFEVPMSLFAFLDVDMRWRIEAGEVELSIGASSDDLRATRRITITDTAFVQERTRAFWATSSIVR